MENLLERLVESLGDSKPESKPGSLTATPPKDSREGTFSLSDFTPEITGLSPELTSPHKPFGAKCEEYFIGLPGESFDFDDDDESTASLTAWNDNAEFKGDNGVPVGSPGRIGQHDLIDDCAPELPIERSWLQDAAREVARHHVCSPETRQDPSEVQHLATHAPAEEAPMERKDTAKSLHATDTDRPKVKDIVDLFNKVPLPSSTSSFNSLMLPHGVDIAWEPC
jgi:hypothetical protein